MRRRPRCGTCTCARPGSGHPAVAIASLWWKHCFNKKAASTERLLQQKGCFNKKVGGGSTDTNDVGCSSSLPVSVPLCLVRLARSGAEQGLAHAMALSVQLLRPHPFVSAITAYRTRHKRSSQTLLNLLCLAGAGAGQGLAHAVGGGRGARRRAAALAAPAPSWRQGEVPDMRCLSPSITSFPSSKCFQPLRQGASTLQFCGWRSPGCHLCQRAC